MTLPAGRYGPDALLDADGDPIVAAVVTVYLPDGVTPAQLWQDADRGAPLVNPLPQGVQPGTPGLDVLGNQFWFADAGTYVVKVQAADATRTFGLEVGGLDAALADELTTFQAGAAATFGAVNAAVVALSGRVTAVETFDAAIDALQAGVADLNGQAAALDVRVDDLEGVDSAQGARLDAVEEAVGVLDGRVTAVEDGGGGPGVADDDPRLSDPRLDVIVAGETFRPAALRVVSGNQVSVSAVLAGDELAVTIAAAAGGPGGAVDDATATQKGVVQLAGDLAGTAGAPTVPGLAGKVDAASVGAADGVAPLDGNGLLPIGRLPDLSGSYAPVAGPVVIDGAWVFNEPPVVPTGALPMSAVGGLEALVESLPTLAYLSNLLLVTERTVAASDAVTASDEGNVIALTGAAAQTVTVPANSTLNLPVGAVVEVARLGQGAVTIVPAGGVTLRSRGGLLAVADGGLVRLRQRAVDDWHVTGDLV